MNRIKPLKHYRRKRFFYHFFCMKSSRSGAMTGLAWLMFIWELFPVFVWKMAPVVAQKGAAVSSLIKFFLFIVLPSFLIWLYGVVTYYHNLYHLQRKHFAKKKIFRVSAFFSALLFPLSGILTAILLLKTKRFLFIPAALGSLVAAILPFFEFIEIPTTISLLFLSMNILLLISLAGMPEQKKIRKTVLFPLVLMLLYVAGMGCWYLYLSCSIYEKKKSLSDFAGHSVSLEAFWERNQKGLPITAPQLQKLIAAYTYQREFAKNTTSIKTASEARKKWQEYRTSHRKFIDSAEEFLTLSPQPICMKNVKGFAALVSPDIKPFLDAGRFYVLEIRAFPEDKERIKVCNQKIMKFRDWLLFNETIIGKLAALSLELSRLSALSETFFSGNWKKSEMFSLIGERIPWKKQMRICFGIEAAIFENLLQLFQESNANELCQMPDNELFDGLSIGYFIIPFFMKVHTLSDYHKALGIYETLCEAAQNDRTHDVCEIDSELFDLAENIRNSHYITAILCPTLPKVFSRFVQGIDSWQMAKITAEIAEYYHKQKVLPENLGFLPEVPVDAKSSLLFQYKITEDGFLLYPVAENGSPPEEHYCYKVRIEK